MNTEDRWSIDWWSVIRPIGGGLSLLLGVYGLFTYMSFSLGRSPTLEELLFSVIESASASLIGFWVAVWLLLTIISKLLMIINFRRFPSSAISVFWAFLLMLLVPDPSSSAHLDVTVIEVGSYQITAIYLVTSMIIVDVLDFVTWPLCYHQYLQEQVRRRK